MKTKENNDFNCDIGERIRISRESQGFSRAELAEAAQISEQTVYYKIETGQRTVNSFVLLKITDFLGVSVINLLYGNTSEEKDLLEECLLRNNKQLSKSEMLILKNTIMFVLEQFKNV